MPYASAGRATIHPCGASVGAAFAPFVVLGVVPGTAVVAAAATVVATVVAAVVATVVAAVGAAVVASRATAPAFTSPLEVISLGPCR